MKELIEKLPLPVLIGIVVALLVVIVLTIVLTKLLYICRPNEILIFSGRKQQTTDGRAVGFRVVFGGRGFRTPLVESVVRMDVSLISVPMSVSGAYSKGGIPLALNAIANVKVSTDPRIIGNAIERFLGVGREQIARVAKETLEGHLRGVLAAMTPEEVNEDRLMFAKHLESSAGPDLEKLGLHLDTLKIQHVADDRNYLQSIGRQRIAEILRGAEIAESDAVRGAQEAEAAAAGPRSGRADQRRGGDRQEAERAAPDQAPSSTARPRPRRRRRPRRPSRPGPWPSSTSSRSAASSSSSASSADVEIPAEIDRQAKELDAAGAAAPIAANGDAMSRSLAEVTSAWQESGGKAMDMFILQHLDEIFAEVANAARRLKVGQVNLIDSGDGTTVAAYASAYPQMVGALLDQVTRTLGIDVAGVISGEPAGRNGHQG